MNNLELYDLFRKAPESAKRTISAGRLKGMTDINPMWRIKALTERFGPCGIGWKYTILSQWVEPGADGVVSAFCNITLQYKWEGEWSEPIPGTGGSAYVAKERNGLYTSDECYKQALTDAISVAAKALGIGADVYWDKDKTKYGQQPAEGQPKSGSIEKHTTEQEVAQAGKEEILPPGQARCPKCGRIQGPRKGLSGYEVIARLDGMCDLCYSKAHRGEVS